MLVPNQKVKIKWTGSNKAHFLSKTDKNGNPKYVFTKMFEEFWVDVEDLMPKSNVKLEFICDNPNCKKRFFMNNAWYQNEVLPENKKTYCKECSYRNIAKKKIEANKYKYKDKLLDIYKQVINGELKKFPDGYWSGFRLEDAAVLFKYFIELLKKDKIINNINDLPKVLDNNLILKYKLFGITERFNSFDIINFLYPNKFKRWEFKAVSNGFWKDRNNRLEAMQWFVNKLYSDFGVKSVKDLPKTKLKNYLCEYGLSGILNYYGNSLSKAFLDLLSEEINEWDLCVSKGYYQDDKNKEKIMKWLVNKMFEDGIIKDIDDIPKVAHRDLFKKYNLDAFLTHCFNTSPAQAFNFIFPNRWKAWEYKYVPMGFWNNGKNVREAIDWFVQKMKEDNQITDEKDLINLPLSKFFKKYGLAGLWVKYDIPFLMSLLYEWFDAEQYKNVIQLEDGTRLDSKQEAILHKYLKEQFNKIERSVRFINENDNETYIVDWVVDGNIIIEYFGLYDKNSKTEYIQEYSKKVERKKKFFKGLKGYNFLDIYPEDIANDLYGFKNKINKYLKNK